MTGSDVAPLTTAQERLYKTLRGNMPLMLKGHLYSSNFTEHLIGYVSRNFTESYRALGMLVDNYHPVRDRLRQFYTPPPITPLWADMSLDKPNVPWQSYNQHTEEYEVAQPTQAEYEAMNKNYEEKQYVNGLDASTLTLDQLVSAVLLTEASIKRLKKVKTKSKAINKQVKQYKADISSIVALMDKEMDNE